MFEKFRKNKKKNIIIVSSVLGILMIVGVITLFRTFAFYEEKRDFNVIKGRVPEFSHEDIQLAFTINGAKGEVFPTVSDGYIAKNVTCEKGATANWSNSLWALTNINSNGNKKVYCSVDFVTGKDFTRDVKIGDYVSYTPEKTSFEIANILTGVSDYNSEYSTDIKDIRDAGKQTINPSELNLWRVIRKNEDGSIDLVSQYASSTVVGFYLQKGYKNYVGTLNQIAKSYETEGITNGSRYMGYNGQTEYITDEIVLNQDSWTEATTAENSPKGSTREAQGGGDVLYETDMNLVKTACGTLKTFVYATTRDARYWLASRSVYVGTYYSFSIRYIKEDGGISVDDVISYNSSVDRMVWHSKYLRPIVILKSGIQANSGDGSSENPWKIN